MALSLFLSSDLAVFNCYMKGGRTNVKPLSILLSWTAGTFCCVFVLIATF